ncbi:hypothetical protein [Pseudonocardia hydrocarbonoxydans]|uniref:hypothetical protein n=1 Tax=Pseudonocardia hydrocarbonoxydans TaxID=76726 RepID=UPI0031D8EF93
MPWIRNVTLAALVATLLVVSGWRALPQPPSDLVSATGCSWIQTEQLSVGRDIVIDVRATGCAGAVPQNGLAVTTHIAGATWESLQRPVDAIQVQLLHDGDARSGTVLFSSTTLAAHYELGSAPRPMPSLTDALWLLVPAGYLAAFAAMCLVVAGLRRAGAVLLIVKS